VSLTPSERERVLSPRLVGELSRFRLTARRRVAGRYAGAHASKRFGSSLDFADYREYVAGDDPRRVDLAVYQRLGRLLVKLYEAEDEAAVRVVIDLSASMGFGRKATAAREMAAALVALAANGQDRVRLLVAGATRDGATVPVEAGPWLRGPSALPAAELQLLALAPPAADDRDAPPGRADLVTALRRAHGEGPRGPVVLVSDLLFDGWEETLRTLAAGRGDALLVHVLGRDDLEPAERGDLRLVDAETGEDVEVAIADDELEAFARRRDAWLGTVEALAGRHGIGIARLVDDRSVEDVVLTTLRELGVVA
jgi:uncharacterized protein (DUF58 family)